MAQRRHVYEGIIPTFNDCKKLAKKAKYPVMLKATASKDKVVRSVRELGQLGFFDAEQISPRSDHPLSKGKGQRAKLAWYNIDPLFYSNRRPAHERNPLGKGRHIHPKVFALFPEEIYISVSGARCLPRVR